MAGGDGFHVRPEDLRGYSGLLERSAEHFGKIEQHARSKGGDTSGFTGLLALLVPIVDGVVNLYADTLKSANEKLTKVKSNLDATVDSYVDSEKSAMGKIDETKGRLDSAAKAPTMGGGR